MQTNKIMKQLYFLLLLLPGYSEASAQTAYDRLWADSALNRQIDDNIERFRKGDALIQVIDGAGQPVADARVTVRQRTSDFLFGSNLFVLGQLGSAELNRKYEEAFLRLFNFATVPFYWKGLEPDEGRPRYGTGSSYIWRRPPPDSLIMWCIRHHVTVKGHALLYAKNMFMPDWTKRDDPDAFLIQARRHMAGLAERYGNSVSMWDVANEEMPRKKQPELWHQVPDDYLSWCFREADSLFDTKVKLLYNDGTYQVHQTTDTYKDIFGNLRAAGRRVDGMGIQFHAFNRKGMLAAEDLTPDVLTKAYRKLSTAELPLYITEVTIPGNGEKGAELQAVIVKHLYRLWFSTPRMAGITWWNLGDGTAFGGENLVMGGLLDSLMNPKPAYRVLDTLINRDWRTQLHSTTDRRGKTAFRGFYGVYELEVISGDKRVRKQIHLGAGMPAYFTVEL